jgi:glycosyltransferase involved in cell wall biosynthesis
MKTPLVLVGNHKQIRLTTAGSRPPDSPRNDYDALAARLGMASAAAARLAARPPGWLRRLEDASKLDLNEALAAAGLLACASVLVSLSERVAIPLAAALRFQRRRVPHVVVAHKLSSGLKTVLLKAWPLQRSFTRLVCLARPQISYATRVLGMDPGRVLFAPSSVDAAFFHPLAIEEDDFVLAVGNEQRDYPTLLQALAGTGLKLTIVASSPWSSSRVSLAQAPNLTLLQGLPWEELRRLYAAARLVVVPLHSVDYAAGVTGLLEGMAMARPVIAARTPGLEGYLADRSTGRCVPPADPLALRQAILDLWESPAERARLAANARRAVEEELSLDLAVERMARIVEEAANHWNSPAH